MYGWSIQFVMSCQSKWAWLAGRDHDRLLLKKVFSSVYPFGVGGGWLISSSHTSPCVCMAPRGPTQEITAGPPHLEYKGWTDVGPYTSECDWDVLLNTNDLSSLPPPFSPWRAARTGWWKAKIKRAFKSNSIPLFHISPSPRNPSPVARFQSCPSV